MKIITVSMMKNEEAFAESSIRYWLTFSDAVIVFNHNSTDGTEDILNALHKEYPERVVFFIPPSKIGIEYAQAEITNSMIREAVTEYNADLVMPLDADEFPYLPGRPEKTIRDFLCSLDLNACYRTFWMPFASAEGNIEKSRFAPMAFTCKRRNPFKCFPKCIISGNNFREDPIYVTIGNHTLFCPSGNKVAPIIDLCPTLVYAHYMFHDVDHYKYKVATGWLASYIRTDWKQGESGHYFRALPKLVKGEIDKAFVDWAALTCQGMIDENKETEIETIKPEDVFRRFH